MKSKTNEKSDSPLRTPKAKNRLGLRIPKIAMPHDDLISPEKPKLEAVPFQNDSSKLLKTKQNGITGITDTTGITEQYPISPTRDFTKTPNSIARLVLMKGLFRGKSKHIYDYLWSNSRGAINPARFLRKTHKEIQKGSGVGSRNTILDGLKHLQNIGLIKFNSAVGEAFGNEYEVFAPEELGYTGITGTTGTTGTSQLYQQLVQPVVPTAGTTGITQTTDSKGDREYSNTSFKDFKENDDDAYAKMLEILTAASAKILGRGPRKSENENWKELAELLVLELELAAALTKTVSNVPAFLTEHLRRRLSGKKLAKPKTSAPPPFEKSSEPKIEDYEAEPLTEQGRETVLKTFREYAERGQQEFILSFEENYTPEDWRFLMDELRI